MNNSIVKENILMLEALVEYGLNCTVDERIQQAIENILADRERLKKENENLNFILKAGLSKEKQYCFNEDGNTEKCLGYTSFFSDEPCDYCKSCKRINIREDN